MIHNTHKGLLGIKRTHASDAWRVAAFLALSGGFQDAYSFLARGHVFANAQTGNIVLFGTKVFALAHGADKSLFYYGDWIKKPGVAIVSCNDGLRPVIMKLEATDEESKIACERQ